MLFSYKIFIFSQLSNKFHNKKFQYINLKQTKPNKNQNKIFVKLKNLVKRREGGKESDRQLREGRGRTRKREIGHGWVIGAISPMLGCDETGAIYGWEQWYDIFLLSLSLSLSLFYFPRLEII